MRAFLELSRVSLFNPSPIACVRFRSQEVRRQLHSLSATPLSQLPAELAPCLRDYCVPSSERRLFLPAGVQAGPPLDTSSGSTASRMLVVTGTSGRA